MHAFVIAVGTPLVQFPAVAHEPDAADFQLVPHAAADAAPASASNTVATQANVRHNLPRRANGPAAPTLAELAFDGMVRSSSLCPHQRRDHMADATVATRELSDGASIPVLGLGVWQVPDGPECVNTVRAALELGYHHIDTAQAYGNEESVGRALAESGVPRDQVFVTTKFNPRGKKPDVEAERSLKRLGLDYVDLYIIHWPQGGPTWAWPGMERARELGYARSIGVSNFNVGDLRQLLATATVPPAVNQVQFSPFEYRKALLESC